MFTKIGLKSFPVDMTSLYHLTSYVGKDVT